MSSLLHNDQVVDDLRSSLRDGEAGLKHVPALLKRIIKDEMWKKRKVIRSKEKLVSFNSFEDFVTSPPLDGLGEDLASLKRLCRDDDEACTLIDSVTGNNQGRRTDLVNNVNKVDGRPTGNSKDCALRKLRKDRPDLHKAVLAKELTPHGAMVKAGFRKRPTAMETVRRAYLRLSQAERGEFWEWVELGCEVKGDGR